MAQSISLASALEKSKINGSIPFLVTLDIQVLDPATGVLVSTLHVVRDVNPLTINGVLYTPMNFDLSVTHESKTAARVQLSVTDMTGALQAYLEQYGGGTGFTVVMNIVNAETLTQEITETFQITGTQSQSWTTTFTLGAESDIAKAFPRRRQTRDFCQWRFGDPTTCRYRGSLTTCDLSLLGPNGCKAHNNTINFGGFPGINSNNFQYGSAGS